MNTLYWITVLGATHDVLQVASIMIIISLIIAGSCILANWSEFVECPKVVKVSKILIVSLIICALGHIFIPSTKQLYIIYGVGTVLDYAKDSKEMRKLPDTAIKALNKYLEYKGE